jgi:alpha-L-fucosidase
MRRRQRGALQQKARKQAGRNREISYLWGNTGNAVNKQIDRLTWFREAKFGMFIHWGVYSLQRNGEWTMNADSISVKDYRELARQFRAERLDVDAWVKTAKAAGMTYMVLTTKHHDGFCLWDTKTTDFNAVKTGPRRDVVREFVEACRRHGIRVGLYWSWVDWNYPDWAKEFIWSDLNLWRQPFKDPAKHARMVDYLHAQVRELMTHYGPIDVFWFDGGFLTAEQYRSRELVDEMRRLQPGILINDRAGFPGDFGSPEGLMPTEGTARAWELCHCSAAFTTWTVPMDDPALFAPPFELLGLLSDAVGLGGNLLLNFGPQADGTFPEPSIDQLRTIGTWMQKNGKAIYGAQAGPTGRQEWGVSTQKDTTVYLHLFRPAPQLAVRGFATKVQSARLLDSGKPVQFSQKGATVTLTLPPAKLLPQVVALEFAQPPKFKTGTIRQRLDGDVILTANQAVLRTTHADGKPVLFPSPDALGGRIMGWKRLEDYVEWTFRIDRAGRYRPSFEFNNPESLNCYGRRLEMTVAGQTLRASVPLSGRHGRFDRYPMAGAFTLKRGEHTLTVKPNVLDPGILMNLRAVLLSPAG